MRARYRVPHLRTVYEACIRLARDPKSEFWNKDGTQRTGSRIRECFWAGYNRRRCITVAGSQARAAYFAGFDFAAESRPASAYSYRWHGGTLDEEPDSRTVKDVLGAFDIRFMDGSWFTVKHHNNWGDSRFPWEVERKTDPTKDEPRDPDWDDFAQFREAVAAAKRRAKASVKS